VNEKSGYPRVQQKNCIACFCCMESCPKGAIVLQLYLGSLFCVARQRRRKGTT
jgi:Fe-S-cluster-containing hydrogenase component 2